MYRKLSEEEILYVKLTFELLFSGKYMKRPQKMNKHKFKYIDFYQFMGGAFDVHWKTIERIVRFA